MNDPDHGTPLPAPAQTDVATPEEAVLPADVPPPLRLDPTRYGDWELGGKCVDF